MKTTQRLWTPEQGWKSLITTQNGTDQHAQLVLVFGSRSALADQGRLAEIRGFCPEACLVGCSTAGEIAGTSVHDDSIVATAVFFEKTEMQVTLSTIETMEDTYKAGQRLAQQLNPEGLVHVFVLSDGLSVNGSALAGGLASQLLPRVSVTGGLAGDAANFEQTLVLLNDKPSKHTIAAIGLYGDHLKVGYGSHGGWDSFGPDRLITRSKANILYELDGQPALELYKTYLANQAEGLPATGLLFPLSLTIDGSDERLVRTILAVNDEDGSMTFAGDVPEGSYARLMKANLERLVEGAAESARHALIDVPRHPDLAVLISCFGRKLVLKQRIDEEVEITQNVLGADTTLTGFYSYGELCPTHPGQKQAELHNQTMTVTTFTEC